MIPLTKQSDNSVSLKKSLRENRKFSQTFRNTAPEKLLAHDQSIEKEFDIVALILAGGRGTRLHPLTVDCCKPAVPFGGSCCIIDFALSNCMNSGIQRIGVLTQYRQHSLIKHLQMAWSQSNQNRNQFVDVFPAQHDLQIDGYRGTADAVAQNLPILQQMNPELTLILAGDHVYKADYRRMIRRHLQTRAEVSVACCRVNARSASRFGVVEVDKSGKIAGFQEKPRCPVTLAEDPDMSLVSMGIYVFNTEVLTTILGTERAQPSRSYDFGQDLLPSIIKDRHVQAFDFDQAQKECYWQDIGTIDSYFDANMQMLQSNPAVDLNDPDWPIHTHTPSWHPARLSVDSNGYSGYASDCIVANGCTVKGAQIRHSILFSSAVVNEKSVIENSLILPGAIIGRNCKIRNTIVNTGVHVADDYELGFNTQLETLDYPVSESGIVVMADDPLCNRAFSTNNRKCAKQTKNDADKPDKPEIDQLSRIFN